MFCQPDAQEEIATFSAAHASFTLAAQTDPLAFAHAARNLDLILFHFFGTASPQRHGPRGTVKRFLECHHNVRLHIGAALGCRSASAKAPERGSTASATE